jgi:4-carboxymuconolactone decarboxylase
MARIPYTDPQTASVEVREALDALPALNIFAMLAHAETALVPYLTLGGVLLTQLALDPKLRELAILLVAAHTGAEYEWIQHVGIAKALGIDDEQIAAVQRGDLQATCLDPDARILLRFTHEVLQQPRADDDTFAALRDHFPPRQIIELLLVIGNYHMLARIMTTLDIDLDPAAGSAVIDEAHRRLGG